MASDIFLVKKAQKGSKEAFVQLIQGYERILYNTAYRFLRNEQDVADVLQETILTAYQKINQLKQPRYFNTWLCRILINQCKQLLNTEAYADIEDYQISVDTKETDKLVLDELLNNLSSIYRIPLILYYYNGFSVKEISEILAEPLGTIKSRLARGRALLEKEYTHSEGGVM
ncbi:sigma-70 family RNA polymerase sigma factor [Enterococcus sp. BWB1-3]|uniref:RNA polymerase sigma factor n=1 Tax=Enterococcus sp. BWB1-3 TaxID=2787713 RepID=UPI0019244CFF|nr:sigma-70 family RNA polymerase sigma factor [Enterococcus sp. BWB1-3]MBL1229920.1 sigma-70 family RNA polymerase sigma factor [Enterococcus sp. BWB1-3]